MFRNILVTLLIVLAVVALAIWIAPHIHISG